jgi:threonine dehydrogenase-like Zn-dependent dehydrogenase
VDTGKLKAAAGLGADDTVLADGHEDHIIGRIAPRGFDAVVDATGIPSVIEKSIGYLKKAGKFLIFGVCPKDARISISPYDFFHCDWTVMGSFAIKKNFSQALNFILNHKAQLSSLVSLRGPIEEFPKFLEMKMSRKDLMKAQVQFSEEA